MKRSRVILSTIISSLILVGSASALEYQTNPSSGDNPVTLKFEFGSTLNITTGGNISISDLTPGTKAISASNYNVTVSTNNLTGYTLSATVGCSSGTDCYDSKNLSDGTNIFSMLSADGALTAGTWGVSLDSSATANSNFKTLAKYDETATIINQTTSNTGTPATGYTGTANTTVRVGAYATNSQVAGTYTNSINFIAVANAMPEFMQDMTSARMAELLPNEGDIVTLYDKRDGAAYAIGKLADDNYWMLDNLRLGSISTITLDSNNTNLPSGVSWTLPASGTVCFVSGSCTGTDGTTTGTGYTVPAINSVYKDTTTTSYGGGSGKIGVYYNYCAASVGDICTDNNSDEGSVDRDICPKGWRMPTGGISGEYKALYTSYLSNATDFKNALSTPLSGVFINGSAFTQGSYGNFWSATRSNNTDMYLISVEPSGVYPSGSNDRYYGYSVRCIFK